MAATKTKAAPKKKPAPKRAQTPEEAAAKLDQGLEDLEIVQVDGASAVFKLGGVERLVRQDDLFRTSKKIAKAIQETY